MWSPSARKVWIEMSLSRINYDLGVSRLPQGRCGLKYAVATKRDQAKMSPSARKVWIEIKSSRQEYSLKQVAFRKEGVD